MSYFLRKILNLSKSKNYLLEVRYISQGKNGISVSRKSDSLEVWFISQGKDWISVSKQNALLEGRFIS